MMHRIEYFFTRWLGYAAIVRKAVEILYYFTASIVHVLSLWTSIASTARTRPLAAICANVEKFCNPVLVVIGLPTHFLSHRVGEGSANYNLYRSNWTRFGSQIYNFGGTHYPTTVKLVTHSAGIRL